MDRLKELRRPIVGTVASKKGAQFITESMGEIHASPRATPFKLLLIILFCCACNI